MFHSTFGRFLPLVVFYLQSFYLRDYSTLSHFLPSVNLCSVFLRSVILRSVILRTVTISIHIYNIWISRRHRHIRRPLDLKQERTINMLNRCVQFYACSDNVHYLLLRQFLFNKILISNLSFVTRPRGFQMKIEVKANGS